MALTRTVTKCFKRLVLSHIKCIIPPDLGNHQLSYRANLSTQDAITTALHMTLTYPETPNSYVRMLFVDFSFVFSILIPHKMINKLNILGLDSSLHPGYLTLFKTDHM